MSLEDLLQEIRERYVDLDGLVDRAEEPDVPNLVEQHLEVAQRHVRGAQEAIERELEGEELVTDGGLEVREGEYADLMPDMSEEEYDALKQSIEREGLKHPIEVTPEGTIVDGHHRYRACRELGVEPDTVTADEPSVEAAIRTNFTRRNLNDGTKRAVVEQYLEEHYAGEATQREVAEALGVSLGTVNNAWKEVQVERFSREEKRSQAAQYIGEHPDASNREVAEAIEADVSHATIGNWRAEWEDEPVEELEEAQERVEEARESHAEIREEREDGGAVYDAGADSEHHYNPARCRAITAAGGEQCSSWMTPLCGNHEDMRNLVRVNEFDEGPNEDLRDELMEHCEMPGQRAYAMAVLADDINDLWAIVTGLKDVTVGPHEWTGSSLATWADNVAMHPDLDVDWSHPLAAQDCVAITGSDEQCPNGSYGTSLLCGTHQDVDDPDTVLERDGLLEDLREVYIDGYPHYVVEERGDDLVVITPDWELERVAGEGVVDLDSPETDDETTEHAGDAMYTADEAEDVVWRFIEARSVEDLEAFVSDDDVVSLPSGDAVTLANAVQVLGDERALEIAEQAVDPAEIDVEPEDESSVSAERPPEVDDVDPGEGYGTDEEDLEGASVPVLRRMVHSRNVRIEELESVLQDLVAAVDDQDDESLRAAAERAEEVMENG